MLTGYGKKGFRLEPRLVCWNVLELSQHITGSEYQTCQFKTMSSLAFLTFYLESVGAVSTFVWILNCSGGKDSVAPENLFWVRAVASVPIAGKNIYKNRLKMYIYIFAIVWMFCIEVVLLSQRDMKWFYKNAFKNAFSFVEHAHELFDTSLLHNPHQSAPVAGNFPLRFFYP